MTDAGSEPPIAPLVVGVGASAGGLEAVSALLRNVPVDAALGIAAGIILFVALSVSVFTTGTAGFGQSASSGRSASRSTRWISPTTWIWSRQTCVL